LAVAGFEVCIVDQRLADGQAQFFNMGIAMIKALLCTLFRLAASLKTIVFYGCSIVQYNQQHAS
jgi:hypothetical protein